MISLLEIAQSINEVDDEKVIKYKKKDGESGEMKAGSAKSMPKDHPAKLAWDKMQDDSGDDKKDSGGKLGGSDFDRDSDDKSDEPKDEPKGDPESQYKDALKKANDLANSQYDSQGNPNPQGASNKQINMAFKKAKDLEDEIRSRDKKAKEKEDEPKKKKGFFNKMFGKKDEPKGELPPKIQNAVGELEDLQDPDEIEGWIEDHQRKLMGGKVGRGGSLEVDKFAKAFRDMEDSYGDDEEYDEKLQNFKGMVDKTMDRYRKKSESIKVIDGKKYKAIKESKKHPLKEIYDRTFRSLK